MEAIAIQKNAGPIEEFIFQGIGTDELKSEEIKDGILQKFPESCGACGSPLAHGDLIGQYRGTFFVVKGYICPACGHKVGKIHMKNCRNSVVRFDWTRLEIPLSGKDGRTEDRL